MNKEKIKAIAEGMRKELNEEAIEFEIRSRNKLALIRVLEAEVKA